MQEPSGSLRTDAAVNCGNTLCAWAEAAGPTTSLPLFERAVDAYRVALAQEEDALVRVSVAANLFQAANIIYGCLSVGKGTDMTIISHSNGVVQQDEKCIVCTTIQKSSWANWACSIIN